MRKITILLCLTTLFLFGVKAQSPANPEGIPGVVISSSPDVNEKFIGSPSICKLPNGIYLATHDFFPHGEAPVETYVFTSSDKGNTWKQIAQIDHLTWASLFYHKGAVYLLGCTTGYGDLVIRKSLDEGYTWTTPRDAQTGLLLSRTGQNGYHTAPVPVVIHEGRIWRGIEEARGYNWGENFWAFVFSAPVDADLLHASSWTKTNSLQFNRTEWIQGGNPAWLEGNVVVTPDNKLVNILRTCSFPGQTDDMQLKGYAAGIPRYELAAMIKVETKDKISFDPAKNFIHFPGSQSKFTIRYDKTSGKYWSLVQKITYIHNGRDGNTLPHHQRNVLMLTSSTDLKNWKEESILLRYKMGEIMENNSPVGFQYLDWFFENDDIVAVSRTSWNNARNYHDANFLTFHRITGFRTLQMKDSPADLAFDYSFVPGNVICHMPSKNRQFIGSPSLSILADGTYIASHDHFGPESSARENACTNIYRSEDKGVTWQQISTINQFWSGLFTHNGHFYIMGVDNEYGNCIIRRSEDGGFIWTAPNDIQSGLIRKMNFEKGYHTSALPVVFAHGRIWRAYEIAHRNGNWGKFESVVLSAPTDSDLLDGKNWKESSRMSVDTGWGEEYNTWLEGNIVLGPDSSILNILRVNKKTGKEETAAIIQVSPDGESLSFDPAGDFISFPGGCKKFMIRYDPVSQHYWALSNWVAEEFKGGNVERIRNTLALISSKDLHTWDVRSVILQDKNINKSGFQYPDWLIEGDDLIFVCRTAFFDGCSYADNQHNSNFITFHRISNFRENIKKIPLIHKIREREINFYFPHPFLC